MAKFWFFLFAVSITYLGFIFYWANFGLSIIGGINNSYQNELGIGTLASAFMTMQYLSVSAVKFVKALVLCGARSSHEVKNKKEKSLKLSQATLNKFSGFSLFVFSVSGLIFFYSFILWIFSMGLSQITTLNVA